MGVKTGVLLDITGIQNYIFGTSRLLQIVGASGNVSVVLSNDFLNQHLDGAGEVIYSGGGNALLLFDTGDQAKTFCRKWSLEILKQYPGLVPQAGLYSGEYSDQQFGLFLAECRKALADAKGRYQTRTSLPRYGITAECVYTGTSAQYCDRELRSSDAGESAEFYSELARTKQAGFRDANKRFQDRLGHEFTDNFQDLAGTSVSGYRSGIAIVHIDGNDMGDRFSKLSTKQEYEQESRRIREDLEQAVKAVVDEITGILREKHLREHMGLSPGTFPFRPIILGGDDLTYVCHASLGVWSAHAILKKLAQQQGSGPVFTVCAGIVHTKPDYPFAQGYAVAEQLCESAKCRRREFRKTYPDQDLSFLDFHILKGGAFSDIDSIRAQNYTLAGKALSGRPFGVGKGQEAFEWLVRTAREVEKSWPRNKLKELREAVFKGDNAVKLLYEHMKNRHLALPDLQSRDPRPELGQPTEVDLCEFLDIYPTWLHNLSNGRGKEAVE